MDSSLTAKKIAARFEGPEGARLLCDIIQRQPLTGGKPDIVEQLAYVAKIEPYETSEIIIQQDEVDTDIFFILSGSVTVSPNRRFVPRRLAIAFPELPILRGRRQNLSIRRTRLTSANFSVALPFLCSLEHRGRN